MNTEAATSFDRYARLAGFLFLFYIASALTGSILMSSYHVTGDFNQTRENILAAGLSYRITILMQLAGDMAAIGLGWALYVLLKPIHANLALLAFLWRVAEGSIGAVASAFRLLAANVFTTGVPTASPEVTSALAALMTAAPRATFPVVVLYFTVGSLLFFWLLMKSAWIPRMLSILGIFGSVCAMAFAVGVMLAPERAANLQFLWLPLLLAEVGTGLWLLIRGATRSRERAP